MQDGWEDGDPHRMRGSQRDRSRKNQVLTPTLREGRTEGGVSHVQAAEGAGGERLSPAGRGEDSLPAGPGENWCQMSV